MAVRTRSAAGAADGAGAAEACESAAAKRLASKKVCGELKSVHGDSHRCKLRARASACSGGWAGTGLAPSRLLCYSQRLSLA